jgi:nitrous oxide reductase accessory protein NosL
MFPAGWRGDHFIYPLVSSFLKEELFIKIKTVLLLSVALIILPVSMALAFERCIMCGMDAQKSETKFVAQVIEGTRDVKPGKYSFCCLHCLVLFEARLKGGKIGSIMVRDYNTVTDKYDSGEMIDAEKAFYLVESGLLPRGSMVPFMTVFFTAEIAEKYKRVHDSKILNWKEVWRYTKNYR